MKQKKTNSFEVSFSRLQKILELLESDQCTLEQTLKLYEEGLQLTKYCQDKLNNAELKIKEINNNVKSNKQV